MADGRKSFTVGSRNSQLALIQTNTVIDWLKLKNPDVEFKIVSMTTTGDKILDTALSKIGEKSLFTKELENALLDNTADFVVHSLKDLPTILPEGLAVGAVCKRDDPRDALVLHPKNKGKSLDTLPANSIIGTSSLRRGAQLKRKYPHLQIKDVRGNLNTRLRKLDQAEDYDALVLAVAGLQRMGWDDRVDKTLEPSECMYAVSQGAMAVECRIADAVTMDLLACLHDRDTLLSCVAERAFLRTLEGGCSVPVAVCTELEGNKLQLRGGVYSISGDEAVEDTMTTTLPDAATDDEDENKISHGNGPKMYSAVIANNMSQNALQAAENLGVELAEKLKAAGAAAILKVAKKQTEDDILERKAVRDAEKAQKEQAKWQENGTEAS